MNADASVEVMQTAADAELQVDLPTADADVQVVTADADVEPKCGCFGGGDADGC